MLVEALLAALHAAAAAWVLTMSPGGGGRPPVPPGGHDGGWRYTVAGWVQDPSAPPPPPRAGSVALTPPPPAGSSSGRWSGGGSCAVWHDDTGRKFINGRWFEPEAVESNVMYRMVGRVLIEPLSAGLRSAPLSSHRLSGPDCILEAGSSFTQTSSNDFRSHRLLVARTLITPTLSQLLRSRRCRRPPSDHTACEPRGGFRDASQSD